jgi:hypothetical protein
VRDQIIEYGTVNPESVTKNERYVYGFDIYNGVFWRDSANGLFPISGKVATESGLADYRMSEYFRTKANDLIAAGLSQVKVFSEWDEYTKCLFVTFLNSTGDEYIGTLSDTIAFHEPSNRWISFYDFWKDNDGTYDEYPDCYMRFKNKFYSFLKGELWKHNSTTADRATYYGTKHDAVIDFVVNNEAGLIKLFDAIGIHTNGDWEAEEITIEDSINYPNGMTSKIPSSVFVKREGVLLSEFLRNMKTRSATATALDLYQGEPLRGRTMYVKLINTATTEVYIAKIDINETISKY